ncbi:helix-turn-helix domain-containing protein [Spirosoma sordidisoli]|uniref:DNA-binding protein n=1 Tax=Spirosoma sordidisoli TaxID=2502893 RepID=A0A4Q2UHK5_9BACT|nr:helix-turn-helix domain-containing protein [Spirosoma sordidisoli]RYC66941.1 DNA-binding protein [Spirosoma sordidisoli]
MQVICLEDKAFYALIEEVVERLRDKHNQEKEKWVSGEQAMQLLNITSKTTLQKLRDEGKIRFSQPQKKIILYDRGSIEAYLERNARSTFNDGRRK